MKKWQEKRNYRRVKDENGQVIANIITVDGMDIEVTEKVFLAYSQADRRERYIMEDSEEGRKLSLDQAWEDGLHPDDLGARALPSAEERCLEQERAQEVERLKQMLLVALLSLSDTDRDLVTALFFDGVSTREYARRTGVTQRAVIKRRDRVLRDMKKFFEKFEE